MTQSEVLCEYHIALYRSVSHCHTSKTDKVRMADQLRANTQNWNLKERI